MTKITKKKIKGTVYSYLRDVTRRLELRLVPNVMVNKKILWIVKELQQPAWDHVHEKEKGCIARFQTTKE